MASRTARLEAIVAVHRDRDGPLLPILHDVQHAFGAVDDDACHTIAAALNLTRAEVYGVARFYHDFRTEPAPRRVVRLCRAEACQARGADALAAAIADAGTAGPDRGSQGGSDTGAVLETVYCLGLCSVGPAAMVGDIPYARLDVDGLRALLAGG